VPVKGHERCKFFGLQLVFSGKSDGVAQRVEWQWTTMHTVFFRSFSRDGAPCDSLRVPRRSGAPNVRGRVGGSSSFSWAWIRYVRWDTGRTV
jgi:hypothetical protein